MPLLDHFHAPLRQARRWESFHSQWASSIAAYLNRTLPSPRFFAEMQIHLGTAVEADVADFDTLTFSTAAGNGSGGGGVAVQPYAPPAATHTMAAVFPDELEVQVFDDQSERRLVAVVELVSPRNKDRPESRRAFAAKCAAYLQVGVGLVVIDLVTERSANLHNELVDLMGHGGASLMQPAAPIYTTAYRPTRRAESNLIDVWLEPLTVGGNLPAMPLALRGVGCIRLDLEGNYAEARERSGL
jgi:hypothetical protein